MAHSWFAVDIPLWRIANAAVTPEGAGSSEVTDVGLIPAEQVKPGELGTLSLRYVDGMAQLVVSDGVVIPAGLTVVDGAGNAVAVYTAGVMAAPTGSKTMKIPVVLAEPEPVSEIETVVVTEGESGWGIGGSVRWGVAGLRENGFAASEAA
ncbi:hypothetical protein ACTU45_26535 [Streptomyces sp. 24-1644]|uniref:hypothetical protein n=1 Tax=Streptomyces sp. 24-1644 TaxID=3457315 RepID=UPI003FA764F4